MSGQEDKPRAGDAPKPEQDPKTGRFVTGNSGGGRPKGSRNKLGEQFIQDLYASWAEKGAETIETVRIERPHEYVKVVASILPKELNVNHTGLDDMSDEQLIKKLRALTAMAKPLIEGLDDSKPDTGTARSIN